MKRATANAKTAAFPLAVSSQEFAGILGMIHDELRDAESKHVRWPVDEIHATAIMMEEAGESMRAALRWVHEDGTRDELEREVVQTGAMCVRLLAHLSRTRSVNPIDDGGE